MTLYGIKNCDSVKKAKRWLDRHSVDYRFHDFRVDGLQQQLLNDWFKRAEYTVLLNTRSRTWKELSTDERDKMQQEKALQLMLEYPTLIKRPVMDTGKVLLVGFSDECYNNLFCLDDKG
ncbi:MAG: ArsC family reductase [Pseudomonadales bacterium]